MNTFGVRFKISIWGKSHGNKLGVLIDGVPVGINIDDNDFTKDIQRRTPNKLGETNRVEEDLVTIESGIFKGKTDGTPLLLTFNNRNTINYHYDDISNFPRPGHADITSKIKYFGFNDPRGGGQFSGRMTLPLVAAGVVAKKVIKPIAINAYVIQIGGENDKNEIEKMIKNALTDGDSLGGIIECVCNNMRIGIGEPFFDSIESVISHIIFSIPGVKGIEFGSGFNSTKLKGSEHNDEIINSSGKTISNNSGGVIGGISNGENLIFRVAFKPPSSIRKTQKTIDLRTGEPAEINIKGCHDVCYATRTPPIVEAAAAIALADLSLLRKIEI